MKIKKSRCKAMPTLLKTGLRVHSMRYNIFVIFIYFIDDEDPIKDDDLEKDGDADLDVDEDLDVDLEVDPQAEADEPPTAPKAPTDPPKQGNFDVHI